MYFEGQFALKWTFQNHINFPFNQVKEQQSGRNSILMPLKLVPGEGLFEININEVVKEDEPTTGNASVYSD